MRQSWTWCMVLALLAAVASCGAEAPAPVATPAPVAKKKVEEAPVPAVAVDYAYNPIGKRDPFRSPAVDRAPADGPKADVVCSDPLCQYDVDDLRVVAMVEDKNGVGFLVRRNSKIGRQGGKVTEVLRDCIVVTSFVTGPDGKAQPNKVNMCIQSDARSAPVMDLLEGKLRQ